MKQSYDSNSQSIVGLRELLKGRFLENIYVDANDLLYGGDYAYVIMEAAKQSGVNPYILEPMKDTLFDEKIAGSIHFTPGNAYKGCDNGNKSSFHWDLVLIQRPEYGGGEIYFDDVLIRKDGRFVLPELDCLNPENLV
jgi:aminopeptidase